MALTVLVAYDISRDDNRARVAAYLQAWGERLQRSVFVCAVAPDDIDEMRERLTAMIDLGTDAVHVLPTCGSCWDRLIAIDQADGEPDKPYWMAV
jgi:CRISPR-associated protein Cas2